MKLQKNCRTEEITQINHRNNENGKNPSTSESEEKYSLRTGLTGGTESYAQGDKIEVSTAGKALVLT